MMMLVLWIKKLLGIKSPNMNNRGFVYDYDYAKALKAEQKFLKLNPNKVTVSAKRLSELESLEKSAEVKLTVFTKQLEPLTIQSAVDCERDYFDTFDNAEHYKAFIAERLIKLMIPDIVKHLDIVTDYNPLFMGYVATGRLTILTDKKEA